MPPRIWNLRINLDEFNAALGSVFTDEDRALLLQGMGLGFNGGLCSNSVPAPFRTGYVIGFESRNEADGYQQKKSIAGLASAETRKGRYGTAQPSKETRTVLEQCSNGVRTVLERCPNQSPIPNPLTNNPQPPIATECEGEPSAKVAKVKKPRGRDYNIAALGIKDEVMTQAERVWNEWPKEGWNFSTKKPAPRRINRALFLERFQEILTHSPIRKADDSRISAEDLANSALEFVRIRIAEGRREGSEIPNVPCVANFFSSCENEKNPWKDALLAYFGG